MFIAGAKMPKRIPLPKVCPVCGGNSLQPVMRHSLGISEAAKKDTSGLLGFRCGKKHVFLISASDLIRDAVKPIKAERKSPREQEDFNSDQIAESSTRKQELRALSRQLRKEAARRQNTRTKEPD
jgi:hypothetical protein